MIQKTLIKVRLISFLNIYFSLSSAQQSGSSFYFSSYFNVSFVFSSIVNYKCHSLYKFADYVSFPALSGTVVVFVTCIYVLFDDKNYTNQCLNGDDMGQACRLKEFL